MVDPSGANPLCPTNTTVKFWILIPNTCPGPYGDLSVSILSCLSISEPPSHCTNGQFTTIVVGCIVTFPSCTADKISCSDFSSIGVVPFCHCTMIILHSGLYLESPGCESATFGWNPNGPEPLTPFLNA